MLSEFPDLVRWENNVRALGHGSSSAMTPEACIERAKALNPASQSGVAANDPQGLAIGAAVTVSPDVDGGEQPVAGNVRFADSDTVVVERTSDEVGTVCVHFPRSGYRVAVT